MIQEQDCTIREHDNHVVGRRIPEIIEVLDKDRERDFNTDPVPRPVNANQRLCINR